MALAGAVAALHLNARAFVRKAEAAAPPIGNLLTFERTRVHAIARGPETSEPILLIHGASANLREVWTALAPRLDPDARVIAFDRPGYGYSERPRRGHQLALQARIAAFVLESLGQGPAIIIAHSFGAAIALRLAIERPDLVSGMVLLAPASHPWPGAASWWANLAANPVLGSAFAGLIAPWIGPARMRAAVANTFAPAAPGADYVNEAAVPLTLRPRAFRASAQDVVYGKAELAAQAPAYGEILAPAIIITADKDRVVSPKIHARALAADLPAAELVIAPGAGHMPHRVRPDLVLSALARLRTMAGASAGD